MEEELVTIEEFKQQVKEIEGVEISIKKPPIYPDRLVRPYNFKRLPDDCTIDDLNERIQYCLRPFIYYIKIKEG